MKIQAPDDDPRLQRLNRPSNQQGAEARPVEKTETVSPIRKVDEERNPEPREKRDRRKGKDRRQRQVPVVLDTRSGRERRAGPRRAEERDREANQDASKKPPSSRGIDIKA